MPIMRVCVRNERQDAVRQVMEQLHTTDPKIAVDWIIADWLNKRDSVTQTQPAAAGLNLEIKEW